MADVVKWHSAAFFYLKKFNWIIFFYFFFEYEEFRVRLTFGMLYTIKSCVCMSSWLDGCVKEERKKKKRKLAGRRNCQSLHLGGPSHSARLWLMFRRPANGAQPEARFYTGHTQKPAHNPLSCSDDDWRLFSLSFRVRVDPSRRAMDRCLSTAPLYLRGPSLYK